MKNKKLTLPVTNVASSNVCKYLDFIAVFGHGGTIMNYDPSVVSARVDLFNALPIPGNELEASLYRNCLSALVVTLGKTFTNDYPEIVKALNTYFDISFGHPPVTPV